MNGDTKPLSTEWIEARFRDMRQRPPSAAPVTRRVAVISTPRCGSTLFCSSLGSTGLFGEASEWLNPGHIASYARVSNLTDVHVGNYLKHVIERTTTPNGVFAINVQVNQINYWKRNGLDVMGLSFDKVIYLYRRDKLSQAYSYAKAIATDQWQTTLSARRPLSAEAVSTRRVVDLLKTLVDWDMQFTEAFGSKVAARFAYEDFASGPGVFREALAACGIDFPDSTSFSTPLGVLRTSEDEERIAEIRNYLMGHSRP